MTDAGMVTLTDKLGSPDEPLEIPEWIETQLREDPQVWENFQNFPHFYQRLKVGWINEAGRRQEEAQKRLDYLLKMTAQNKQYGAQPLRDGL